MAEFKVVSDVVQLELTLSVDETKAFMDMFNHAMGSDGLFSRTKKNTYDILNTVWHKGWEVLNNLGEENKDSYFND